MKNADARHDPTIAPTVGPGMYSSKNWTYRHECPVCGRTAKVNQNFLGQRNVVCDGVKFTKVRMRLNPSKAAP